MQIVINGVSRETPEALSVAGLLDDLDFHGQRVAIELNGTILPRSAWAARCLAPGDQIEIVRAIGGG